MSHLVRPIFISLWVQLLLASQGYAATAAVVTGAEESGKILNGQIDALEDEEGSLTVKEVAASQAFQDTGAGTPNFKFTDSTYWFRFGITNNTKEALLLLEVGYPLLDYVSLFWRDENGEFQELKSGDMLPFSKRAREHRTITFELNQTPGQTTEYYIRAQSSSSLQMPLRVYTELTFTKVSGSESMILGGYYGVILVMILFNGLLGLSLKDHTYYHYIAYLAAWLVVQVALNGNSHRFLFPENPMVSNTVLPVFIFIAMAMAFSFSRHFLLLEDHSKSWRLFFTGSELFGWGCAALAIVVPYAMIIRVGILYAGFASVGMICCAYFILRAGYMPARTYLIAWSVVCSGTMVFLLKTTGFFPSNIFTDYSIQVGSALEVTLLSLALADRIHVIQREREMALSAEAAAHYSLAESYEALNGELERRQSAENMLSLELRARGHLVAETAHRLNNPLNVTLGGLGALEQRLSCHVESLQELFQGLEAESQADNLWLDRMKFDLSTMQEASADARVAAKRVSDFLEEFRAVGGLRGAQNHYTKLSSIFERSNNRLSADLGSDILTQVKLMDEIESVSVWSNEYVAGLLLSYSLRDLLSRNQGEVEVRLHPLESESRISVVVMVGGSGLNPEKNDLVDLSPVQLGEAVGGGTPHVVETSSDGNTFGYTLNFELKPPATRPSLGISS